MGSTRCLLLVILQMHFLWLDSHCGAGRSTWQVLQQTVHHPDGRLGVLDKTRDWEKVVK